MASQILEKLSCGNVRRQGPLVAGHVQNQSNQEGGDLPSKQESVSGLIAGMGTCL